MMVLTHIAVGGMLAGAFSLELVVAGMIGGLVPDLDILTWQHRKDLHFPVYYTVAAVSGLVSVLYSGSVAWTYITAFFASAALHCWMDAFGGGLEPRPWLQKDDRGVYDHYRGKWIETRHWVYDGSPGDLSLMLAAVAGLYLMGFDARVLGVLTVLAVFYALTRKLYPELEERSGLKDEKPSEALKHLGVRKLNQLKNRLLGQ